MKPHEFHYLWTWQLKSSPETLWPLLADTNRSNYDSGLPSIKMRPGDGEPVNARRRLHLRILGIPLDYDEEPFEWVWPRRFGVVRRYLTGPITQMRILAEFMHRPDGGTDFNYHLWPSARNWLGRIAIPYQVNWLSRRQYAAVVARYDRMASSGQRLPQSSGPVEFAPGGQARLQALRQNLLAQGAPPDLLGRLADFVERADGLAAARIQPYALADTWGAPRKAVLELCLLATRAGLLDIQWDLLCPLCRGAKESAPSLVNVPTQAHCETCHIDFGANFERSVELTFRPNAAVRPVEASPFCVGGPQNTPHIVAQQLLPPGAERAVQLSLEPGRYRARAMELPGGQFFYAEPDGPAQATLHAGEQGWPDEELRLSARPDLRLENGSGREQLFILERMAWSDKAVTAAEVTVLQRFRDLFSSEILRPGAQVSVGGLTILFTDLRASTRMYREIGDAPAFGRVLDHFDLLKQAISDEEGAIVKTIGDAVMAVFRRPVSALRAILRAQAALAAVPPGQAPLVLKAGIHAGPCIAVTLNERLDYFGSTVNIASRLTGLSRGNDIILSQYVRADPEVAALLEAPENQLELEPLEARLKGLESEQFELWRAARPAGAA